MQIHFAIIGRESAVLDEKQAQEALAAGTPPSDESYLFGWLRWRHEGQPDLDFNDDLSMLFPACLRTVAALRIMGRAELNMASYYCHLTLIAEGDTVQVFQEDRELHGQEVARYPKDALIDALAACCHRFSSYAQALAELDPQWTGLRDAMSKSSG